MSLFGMGKTPPTKTILIIDAGSSSVGACIALLDKNGPPALLKQARIETPVDAARDGAKLEERMLQAARQAITDVIAEPNSLKTPQAQTTAANLAPAAAPAKPLIKNAEAEQISHVALFLPAPWSTVNLHTLVFSQKDPFKVTAGLLENMIAEYAQKDAPVEEGKELIERSALGIRLNGYMVKDIPKNAAATDINLTAMSTMASTQTLSSLRELVRELMGQKATISFHSTNISLSWGLSTVFPEEGGYLLCNGEGEVTELLLVDEHVPQATATAPQGCSTMLRTLNVHADMARAEASSALTLAKDENSPMQEKLSQTLAAAQKSCAESFESAAKELLSHFAAPAKIYVLALGPEAVWYADALAQAALLKNVTPGGVPVASVPYAALTRYLNLSLSAPTAAGRNGDMFLALEAIFCDSRFDQNRTFNFKIT